MQTLQFAKKSNSKYQKTEQSESEIVENKREAHGRNIGLTRTVYRLQNTNTYYVESETRDNVFYFVKFKPDVFEWCSCKSFEFNKNKVKICKHILACEISIRLGTLKDIDRLPLEAKRDNMVPKSYRDDDYDF